MKKNLKKKLWKNVKDLKKRKKIIYLFTTFVKKKTSHL